MKIQLKLVCPEIFGAMPSGQYEVPENCTAQEALECCAAQYEGDDIMRDSIGRVVYMINGKHVSPNRTVSENDMLMVLRPVFGG
ncbi:MAG: MoaD/ThiS family protein [Oscillospiraceae bacterium]|nr:MoaD/ThiS family protein [Oscillospiraceae bacterium]